MELFTKTKVVKLRSHLDKYLIAADNGETVSQSRNGGNSSKARWLVEVVDGKDNHIRLKSTRGTYLTASNLPFLLGMTGKKVIQTSPEQNTDWQLEWEPIRDGFQICLKSWCGTFLRANGGTPPWRNTVTHDDPLAGATQRWILWDVEAVAARETESLMEYLSSISSFSSISDDVIEAAFDDGYASESGSPMSAGSSVRTPRLTLVKSMSPRLSPARKVSTRNQGMDFFRKAKAVRLRSHHDKYLIADEDEESVIQDRNGSSKSAKWTVEVVPGSQHILRFKSCYGKYLTASNQPFLLGMTGRKVFQTLPRRLDSSVEWEPIREGAVVKLKTRYGQFLRANGGLPPWRNSVTHDIPHRTATQDWVLWHVDVVDIHIQSPDYQQKTVPPVSHLDSLDFVNNSPSSVAVKSGNFLRQESIDSSVNFPPKLEGRTIYYHVGDVSTGEVDEDVMQACSFHFKGKVIEELTQKLREETGLEDVIVCNRNPLNGKLYPLRLQLPPNNSDMHVVLVPTSSKDGLKSPVEAYVPFISNLMPLFGCQKRLGFTLESYREQNPCGIKGFYKTRNHNITYNGWITQICNFLACIFYCSLLIDLRRKIKDAVWRGQAISQNFPTRPDALIFHQQCLRNLYMLTQHGLLNFVDVSSTRLTICEKIV